MLNARAGLDDEEVMQMARACAYEKSHGGELLVGLGLMAILIYRPGWIWAAAMTFARFWDTVVSPALVRLIVGG